MSDLRWHCRSEGSLWKRVRMAMFGLTKQEREDNMLSFHTMQMQAAAASAAEDRLFDIYLAKTDRPTVKEWVRWTETSEPIQMDGVDWAHWERWRKDNECQP